MRRYIYEPIEKGFVLNELDEKNPTVVKKNTQYRKHRHHSHLNPEVGLNSLRP